MADDRDEQRRAEFTEASQMIERVRSETGRPSNVVDLPAPHLNDAGVKVRLAREYPDWSMKPPLNYPPLALRIWRMISSGTRPRPRLWRW